MSKWFSAYKLSLDLDKTNAIKCTTKDLPQYPLNNGHNDKYIEEPVNTKLLGLQTDNRLNRNNRIDHLVPKKLRAACYAVRFMLHIRNTNTLKSIYFAHFH
jgi:hypothetical protein